MNYIYLLIYVLFIIGISIVIDFLREPYVDIENRGFEDRLKDEKFDENFMGTLNTDNTDENFEKVVLENAQNKLKMLGNYNIVQEKTNFENLDKRFNDFHVESAKSDFFGQDPYDNLYYLRK